LKTDIAGTVPVGVTKALERPSSRLSETPVI